VVHSRVTSSEIGAETIDGVGQLELQLPSLWLAPGIYTAYFKFIVPDASSSSGRCHRSEGDIACYSSGAFRPDIFQPPT